MTESQFRLANPPIIEAVVDFTCDMPPDLDLVRLQDRSEELLRNEYPKTRRQVVQHHEIRADAEAPPSVEFRQNIGALLFLTEDEKQVVQMRAEGYSFNRLAPYQGLDEYLPEIERTWKIFQDLTKPVQVRKVGLRFINRILLPTVEGGVNLGGFVRVSPRLPDPGLELIGFVNQHSGREKATDHRVNITLLSQPLEVDRLPIILDIDTFDLRHQIPDDWQGILETIQSLRRLKNRVFERTLTEECLSLFQ
ncbi:MAG TPA: TIGR04255 family protein [Thermoanaerobaculia bacterium]|nr:TIGR04255 family protein [Thermoanaerobaculia bacterium]